MAVFLVLSIRYSHRRSMKKKTLFSFIYMGLTFIVIALVLIFGGTNFEDIGNALKNFNIWWMLACIGALLLFWLTDAWLLHDITGYMYKSVPFLQSLKVGIVGLYYSALTPSSTGGQPMQIMYMKRDKVPVGTSTCIVCIKFVVFELSLCTIFILGMIYMMLLPGDSPVKPGNEVLWLAVLGFVINLAAVFFIILSIVNRKLILGIGNWLIRVFSKIKVIKNKEQTLINFKNTIDEYHTAASYISRYKLRAFGSYLISALNLAFLFIIPYLIFLSLSHRNANIIDFFIMESFLNLAVSFFPLPGAAGASEGGFMLFFGLFFKDSGGQIDVAMLTVAMLIWRFLTYYLMIIVGSIVVVLDQVFSLRKAKKNPEISSSSE
jgi:glycosyltransferase 2 family protein